MIAALSVIATVAIMIVYSQDMLTRMGNLTVWSGGIFVATLIFALASIASAIAVWRAPAQQVRRGVRIF